MADGGGEKTEGCRANHGLIESLLQFVVKEVIR